MKILHINTSDSSGGAAIAAMRLHKEMLANGIDSTFFCLYRSINDDEKIITVNKITKLKTRFISIARIIDNKKKLSSKKGFFSNMKYGYKVGKIINLNDYDIIYLHWINNAFISLKGLEELCKTGKPIYWFMHDMFPITGGCHHSFDCNGYTKNCGNCAYMKKSKKYDFSYKQLHIKHKILDKYSNISFISPSSWLENCAKRSFLMSNHSVYRIPNLINPTIFKRVNKIICRQLLGLSDEKKYIAFGADAALSNPYKGFEYLEKALHILKEKYTKSNSNDIELLIFGSSYNSKIVERLPFKPQFFGYLYDGYSLNLIYNSADVFCVPSLAENFCQTALESVFAGTPVVAFDVGGLPDIVSKKTGYLAKYKDPVDFSYGIELSINRKEIDNKDIVSICNPKDIIQKHKDMWKMKEKNK